MRINTNLSAINTLNQLGRSSSGFAKSVQKLSSGFRINRAADDAAGLGIANRLSADIRSLKQASRNAEQANSLLQVAEGAAQTIQNILERMKELATQSGSDNTDAEGRVQIEAEFTALRAEITRVVETTKFQGKSLLDASFGNSVDTGAGSTALVAGTGLYEANLSGTAAGTYTQTVNFDVFGLSLELDANFTSGAGGTIDSTDLVVVQGAGGGSFMVSSSGAYTSNDLVSLNSLDLTVATLGIDADTLATAADSQAALANIDGAINVLSSVFGDIGAAQNRIDFSFANVNITVENFMAAESVIRDVDMAAEVTEMTKYQILQQAGTAMLAQANAAPQGVLRLLA
jgi:flagellin